MTDPESDPQPLRMPHDPGVEPNRPRDTEDLDVAPDPVDPLKRADQVPGQEDLPGADPTPPPIPPG